MSDSFYFRDDLPRHDGSEPRSVLVTGASGRIGSYFAQTWKDHYDLTLMVLPGSDTSSIEGCGKIVEANLEDLDQLKDAIEGVDSVLHLAGDPSPKAEWGSLLSNNINGTYNLIQAAIDCKCRRLVYASSIHAISGFPVDRQVHTDDSVNPGDLYGVSKCFGEALARYAAEQHKLSSIVVRIGACLPKEKMTEEKSVKWINSFVSRRDISELFRCCIDDERLGFAILHGLSNNLFNRMDTSSARELVGYHPVDDFTELHPKLRNIDFREEVRPHSETGGKE
ncbi:NAD-dependent epimerase/dehydratase family protein [Puniceicoccus vermicola]|uniref:NAD(P)-dependent oxidoreductase n=1 Tax=Puniceicoccus vermicola TaxID=388746 RepID=A0A7X1AVD2_9BACT|nr:NAD(P)-dependent oxidoreductase [Puniceicoccus vermicola]MBC2600429.1 NAD(P)-dependent oxidoreductase [Puniceicoccus vermicola]